MIEAIDAVALVSPEAGPVTAIVRCDGDDSNTWEGVERMSSKNAWRAKQLLFGVDWQEEKASRQAFCEFVFMIAGTSRGVFTFAWGDKAYGRWSIVWFSVGVLCCVEERPNGLVCQINDGQT